MTRADAVSVRVGTAEVKTGVVLINSTTYVPLRTVSSLLRPDAQIAWTNGQAAVTAPGVSLTARPGDLYLQANERCLFAAEGVRLACAVDGRPADTRFSIWSVADIFISFSDNIQETFGLTPVEAMAAGLPSVVTDWDGYRDTVRHGIDQHFVPLHIREFLRHFSGNLIPHHHTMALGVGFGHHGQQLTWTGLRQSEGIAHNACHPNTGKDCHFGTDFFR